MGKIIVLDELTANMIAAGEVIERPASVVKEMVENCIDAGATSVTVEIKRGGISYIRVTDDGKGIAEDDALLAFEKHATSKIRCGDDLDGITTLGFRGEALASIAAVSRVELTTRTEDTSVGTNVVIHGGALVENTQCGCRPGTTFVIRDLFFNTPARFKFLKKDATEAGHIIDVIERIALAKPEISFRLINSGSEVLRTPGDGQLKSAIFSIYGRDVVNYIKEVSFTEKGIEINGFAGDIQTAISSRSRQCLYINGRYVKSRIVTSAIEEAYKTLMMKGKHPFIVLNLNINPQSVDVNVHPTKMEVRFSEESTIFRSIYGAVTNALFSAEQYRQQYDLSRISYENKMRISEKPEQTLSSEILITTEGGFQDKSVHLLVEEPVIQLFEPHIEPHVEPHVELNQELEIEPTVQSVEPHVQQLSRFNAGPKVHPNNEPVVEPIVEQVTEIMPERMLQRSLDPDNVTLKEAQYIGQVFNTYIILQHNDEIIFIDQHAAHERVLFEHLKKNIKEGNSVSQMLMTPVAIELTRSEYQTYLGNQELFTEMGFSLEEFGANSIVVRALPSIIADADVKPLVIEALRNILEGSNSGNALAPEEKLYDIACKAAIKANMKLDFLEVKELLKRMQDLNNPFTCPHGRPLSFRMSKRDMEKKFKRIL